MTYTDPWDAVSHRHTWCPCCGTRSGPHATPDDAITWGESHCPVVATVAA